MKPYNSGKVFLVGGVLDVQQAAFLLVAVRRGTVFVIGEIALSFSFASMQCERQADRKENG